MNILISICWSTWMSVESMPGREITDQCLEALGSKHEPLVFQKHAKRLESSPSIHTTAYFCVPAQPQTVHVKGRASLLSILNIDSQNFGSFCSYFAPRPTAKVPLDGMVVISLCP